MLKNNPIIAIMYDFDKTLCTKDMQEYEFIPKLGMKADEFWEQANCLATKEGMDRILAYMYLMIQKSNEKKIPIHRDKFVELGASVKYFSGLPEWFSRINAYGKNLGVTIEHYVISSGLKEIIEGSIIKDEFKKIYACEYHYNQNGIADWPKMAVNYTTKTQFLFRINKGILDVSDDEGLNKFKSKVDRRIPFRNMIYIGDGFTDIPCMQLVKSKGGQSIAVYKTRKKDVAELLTDGRVDFTIKADYSEDSELDKIVKIIIEKIAIVNKLVDAHKKHLKQVK
jgi:2-hydroxy-3-keto-5-methylthiopentenyl-1-phosphate phosphatase